MKIVSSKAAAVAGKVLERAFDFGSESCDEDSRGGVNCKDPNTSGESDRFASEAA